MAESPRIDDLRRRLLADPASIAFAQLAEEYRRAGQLRESIETCRAGLARHPDYMSARITLARALFASGELDQAEHELMAVLRGTPDNLAAVRGLGEIHNRRGDHREALACFEAALALAWNDPDLEETVDRLRRLVSTPVAHAPGDAGGSTAGRALRTVAALEEWLAAVSAHRAHHVARTQ
jgi:tetratricopeptide (TPR) repeat protein